MQLSRPAGVWAVVHMKGHDAASTLLCCCFGSHAAGSMCSMRWWCHGHRWAWVQQAGWGIELQWRGRSVFTAGLGCTAAAGL